MRLIELNPQFLKNIDEKTNRQVDIIAEADGIMFLCPVCYEANNGIVGTHSIICWSPKVPLTIKPIPGRWNLIGNGYDDLSLVAGSSSILLSGGCNAHFFIRNGNIEY